MIQGLFETDVVSVTAEQPLVEVVELMHNHKIGDVIVVENNRPRGIITDRDIALRAFSGDFSELSQLKVSDAMGSSVITVKESDWLLDVVETMKEAGVVRVPVVDESGNLCGIITDLHCMQALAEALEKITHINQKDFDESTPPTMTTDRQTEPTRPSIQ